MLTAAAAATRSGGSAALGRAGLPAPLSGPARRLPVRSMGLARLLQAQPLTRLPAGLGGLPWPVAGAFLSLKKEKCCRLGREKRGMSE